MFQRAINFGQSSQLTPEKKIGMMLDNGFNVFVLRWKKEHSFRTSVFNMDTLMFLKKRNRALNSVSYVPKIKKGELFFDADETGVPVAYCADTPRNRIILARGFYTAQYLIGGMLTPNGSVTAEEIQKEIKEQAQKLGVKVPVRGKYHGVYGNALPKPMPDAKPGTGKAPEGKKGVYPGGAPPAAEGPKEKQTPEACMRIASDIVELKYRPFKVKLLAKYGNGTEKWKDSKDYKEIFVPEIRKEYERLLVENGHPVQDPPPPKTIIESEPEPEGAPAP